jgi:hypothetical protein
MGNFYTNIAVFAPAEEVAVSVRALDREAYVAPFDRGAVVFDEACEAQDTETLAALAEHLSVRHAAPALAVLNHDDDLLWLQLYMRDDLLAEYCNSGGPRTDVTALCRTLNPDVSRLAVWATLMRPFVTQVQRHYKLATLLRLPDASVGFGFEYIHRGELPHGVSEGQLIRLRCGARKKPLCRKSLTPMRSKSSK